jgi:hypothetical protein
MNRKRILTSSDGWVTAVPAWRASAEERDRALKAFQSARIVRDLQRGAGRSDLLALHEAAMGIELHSPRDVGDHALVAAIDAALSKGQLLLIPGSDLVPGAAHHRVEDSAHETEAGQLVKSIMRERSAIEFEGGRYRLMAVARWSGQSAERDYHHIPEAKARELVTRMSQTLAKSAEERGAWQRIAKQLTDRPGSSGIVLTRNEPRLRVPQEGPAEAPVSRPSPPPPVTEQAWVDIKITYEDGSPFTGNYVIELPGGRRTEGSPDGDGLVRLRGIDPGTCQLSFPELDADAWAQG